MLDLETIKTLYLIPELDMKKASQWKTHQDVQNSEKLIIYRGTVEFEPEHITAKHLSQAHWKKVAMVRFDGEIAEYYSWFLKNRFGLILTKPIKERGSHVTFINDDFQRDCIFQCSREEKELIWEKLKRKWHGQKINVVINTDFHTNGHHWWLNVDFDHRDELEEIRAEVGLGKPNFGLHLTIGRANERNLDYSQYLYTLYKKEYIQLNESLHYNQKLQDSLGK
jgi:hypothetical protein